MDITALSCLEQARYLYNAYLGALTGQTEVQVRHGDYWATYRANSPTDMAKLAEAYQIIRGGCPEAMAQLPPLNARFGRRGPPIQGRL